MCVHTHMHTLFPQKKLEKMISGINCKYTCYLCAYIPKYYTVSCENVYPRKAKRILSCRLICASLQIIGSIIKYYYK